MEEKCSLREACSSLAPDLSNDWGFQCIPQSFISQTGLVESAAAFCGEAKTISGEQRFTANLSSAISYRCPSTALPQHNFSCPQVHITRGMSLCDRQEKWLMPLLGEDSRLSSMALEFLVILTSINHYFPHFTMLPCLLGFFFNEEPSGSK